ncbi:PREDICTED: uncharacterized protein LOC107074033 [Polistes dominula]|uniref:Uncharacterized protein LOC107074033 n=1 Tax=Polistes dominula TaxID=743375 RepID=A0ABM1JDJ6_POLDO|nr:PREDICTED: uncharacterized protein LOC107074033 [Polistes dominula]
MAQYQRGLADKNDNKLISLDISTTIKTLGVHWNAMQDTINYAVKRNDNPSKVTKRNILSEIARIFDPLGLLEPVIINAKILIQKLWQLRSSWDEAVPEDIGRAWQSFRHNLHRIKEVSFPRKVLNCGVEMEIHGFCDASERAYGACIYIKTTGRRSTIQLVCAKSRVALLKTQSLPRLELCGAVLLARLYGATKHALRRVRFRRAVFCSDSTIVLHWLKTPPHILKTFVAHQVIEILESIAPEQWRHVASDYNPADFISRGITITEFIKNDLWRAGPSWLLQRELRWPHQVIESIETPERETFSELIEQIVAGKNIRSSITNLNPFVDERRILRVGGRLGRSDLPYEQKHAALLPKAHFVTAIIIREKHEKIYHGGAQATLNAVSENFWPINGRAEVKGIISRCTMCLLWKPIIPKYKMSELTTNRLQLNRPFLHTRVDFCGPIFIKEKQHRNRGRIKVYVAVFVCFTTKAVHLELVSDLTTESFLACLRRFIARRGKGSDIYSDNATTFVGAANEIQTFAARQLTNDGIKWHFIPPRSPHFGGLWEAAVKSFKHHLVRIIGETLLTYEALLTYVLEIEAILNSRPLTPLSNDPNDLRALTPGHFLIGDSLISLPDHDYRDIPCGRLSQW